MNTRGLRGFVAFSYLWFALWFIAPGLIMLVYAFGRTTGISQHGLVNLSHLGFSNFHTALALPRATHPDHQPREHRDRDRAVRPDRLPGRVLPRKEGAAEGARDHAAAGGPAILDGLPASHARVAHLPQPTRVALRRAARNWAATWRHCRSWTLAGR